LPLFLSSKPPVSFKKSQLKDPKKSKKTNMKIFQKTQRVSVGEKKRSKSSACANF